MFRLPMAVVVIKEEQADEEMPLGENGPEELNGCSDQECNNLSNTLNILHAERNLENGNGCLPNSQISNGHKIKYAIGTSKTWTENRMKTGKLLIKKGERKLKLVGDYTQKKVR